MATRGFLELVVKISKFSGKLLGRMHQMPSVSSSRGRLEWEIECVYIATLFFSEHDYSWVLQQPSYQRRSPYHFLLVIPCILPYLFNNLPCFGDNVSSCIANYTSHLHWVPASTVGVGGIEEKIKILICHGAWEWDSPSPHDVAIERVEDTLVS